MTDGEADIVERLMVEFEGRLHLHWSPRSYVTPPMTSPPGTREAMVKRAARQHLLALG